MNQSNYHQQDEFNPEEEYNPILNVIRNQLKTSGQEIIVRDEKWSRKFSSFLVHKEEDVVAASIQLLDSGILEVREINITQCNSNTTTIWSDYYLIGIKKAQNSLETELAKIGFLKKRNEF